jgi:hypothetical protein
MQFADHIKRMIADRMGPGIVTVTVTAVDEAAATFDAVDVDGIELYDIRLQAVVGGVDGQLVVPALKSTVTIAPLRWTETDYAVLSYSQIAKVVVRPQGSSYLEMDELKVAIGDQVELGGGAQEPAPRGTSLNANLTQLNANLTVLNANLTAFASAQANVAASGPLAPLAPAYTVLIASLQSLQANLTAWNSQLSNHLSQKVTLA